MKLVRFSTGGGAPRLGAAVGPWDRWDWVVDLSAVDRKIPKDTLEFILASSSRRASSQSRSRKLLTTSSRL